MYKHLFPCSSIYLTYFEFVFITKILLPLNVYNVDCKIGGICSKIHSRCLKPQIVPNPVYIKLFPIHIIVIKFHL